MKPANAMTVGWLLGLTFAVSLVLAGRIHPAFFMLAGAAFTAEVFAAIHLQREAKR